MKTEQQKRTRRDVIAICTIIEIAGLILLLSTDTLDIFWKMTWISFLIFCYITGFIGNQRKIGFGGAFFISFLFSPLVGLIVALTSPRLKDEAYKEKMLELAANNTIATLSVADQLYKLNELRKEGALSDEEFAVQKEKLLNS